MKRSSSYKEVGTNSSFYKIDLKDPDTLAAFVDGIWRQRIHLKQSIERDWFINIAHMMGNQNVTWNNLTYKLEDQTVPPWRVRMVINLMQPALRTLLSKILRPRVEWDVTPVTDDAEDIAIADLCKNILHYRWDQLDIFETLLETLEYVICTGNGFIKTYWDPYKGDKISATAADLIDNLADFNSEDKDKLIKEIEEEYSNDLGSLYHGDTCVKAVSPFDVIPDPAAKKLKDCAWIIESHTQYVEAIKDEYGKYAEHVVADDTAVFNESSVNYERKINALQLSRNGVGDASNSELAIVHELYIKPTRKGKFKEGLYAVVCQGKVIGNKGKPADFPYEHQMLPYVHIKEIPVPGQFWATSTCQQLIPVQTEINKTRSQLIENRNLMSRPKWRVPKGSGILNTALTSEPGEVIEHNPGFIPEVVEMPQIPAYVQNLTKEYRQDFEDISGQHEVSRAEAPGEVRSGKGIIALIQQDESRLAPFMVMLDINLKDLGVMILSTDHQYVKEERLAQFADSENELVVFKWQGADLKGKNRGYPGTDYFKVRVKTIPGMPSTRLAQQEFISNLIQTGVLNAEKDRDLILSLYNIGNVDKHVDTYRQDRSIAIDENYKMAGGAEQQVNSFDNHEAHIKIHDQYRKRPEFLKLPDQIKQLFEAHVTQHKLGIALKLAEEQVLLQKATMILAQSNGLVPPGPQNPQPQGNVQ